MAVLHISSAIDGFGWFCNRKSSPTTQCWTCILGPTLFLLYIGDRPDNIFCNVDINTDFTTLYTKCELASNLWQQMASELEYDLWATLNTAPVSELLISCWKNPQLVLFDRFDNSGAIDVKMDASVFKEEESFRILRLFFFLNRIEALILSLPLTLPSLKVKALFILWSFILLGLLFISINLSYDLPWNILCHVSHLSTTFAPIYVK